MQIKKWDNTVFLDAIVTSAAEHEEELMKSDFVKLSWSDSTQYKIPVDSYIVPFDDGVQYSLLEPYYPEQRSECEWKYEPKFQHPKMYLSKVTFKRPSKDSEANDITLLDWSYVGDIYTLLGYFCDQINSVYGFVGADKFGYEVIGELNQNIASIKFTTNDILSALTNTANQCECEYYLDWTVRTLFFGRIHFHRTGIIPMLKVGDNISVASVRSSKDCYWNAFEPQGSTRNMTRRAASGEFVLANVRLSMRGKKYPDGIIYTDGLGNIITKEQFDQRGERAYIKSLILEDVYPKLDLYVYNVRYRERYLLEDASDPDSKVIDHYDANNNPVYKRYAVWYMNLAYPTYDDNKNVTGWTDYDVSDVRDFDTTITKIWNNTFEYHAIEFEMAIKVNATYFTRESTQYPGTYIVTLKCGTAEVKGYIMSYNFTQDGTCRFYTEWANGGDDERDEQDLEKLTAFQNAVYEGVVVTFTSGVNRNKFPKKYSQIIDGKSLCGQFKVNTNEGAETTPLAGRGDGDNGNYGFEMIYLGIEGQDYIDEANREPTEDGDTGIIDMDGNRALATENDYEIVFQQSGDYILPTTRTQLVIPKGCRNGSSYVKDVKDLTDKNIGLRGNIVNLYNIVMDSVYEDSAQNELENETKKYIKLSVEDNDSYTFKSDPLAFSERFYTPLYIGEKVYYADGDTYTEEHPLETRVMRLVTKLDYAFEQEITIGNEVLKGSQQSLKEQVQSMISFGAGGSGGGVGSGSGSGGEGGGISLDALRQAIKTLGADYFLSKLYDDQGNGTIGFLKGIWFGTKKWFIDNSGSANLYNATVNGLLKAYNAIINTVRSTRYSGDGMLDTGWLITDSYGGSNSKAIFDFLYVRKKAMFEELEIRKISHIGGDFALSPASGRAYRVEYYDENDEILGIDEITVPYMIGYRLLLLFSQNMANKYLGRKKLVSRALTDAEKLLVKRVRVYLFSDDGTTKTMSNWTEGAQARCQSFNIKEQMEYHGSGEDSDNPDVGYWTGKKVQNTYWWRLVSAVGQGTLQDGKTHDYVEFLANTGNDYDVADIGSDLPAVGDEFAQFGHRTRRELQNVIMLETARGDSPAIKLYTGINSWDLTGKRVSCISPEMTEFTANRFKLTTDYNGDVQLNDRGLWIDIPTEHVLVELPDVWGDVRKCYYNDIVSHNGKWWQCIVASGTHKEDADGHWYTDAELDWLIAHDFDKYATLVDVGNYTIQEPGDATLKQQTVWVEKTDYLVQVAHLEFSNPMFIGAGSHSSTVTLKVSNLSATIDHVEVEDNENEVTWNGSQLVCNASVNKNRKVKVTAHGILNNLTYTASDVICVYRLASNYAVSATPNAFAFDQNENYPYQMNVDGVESFTYEDMEGGTHEEIGNSCVQINVIGDSLDQPFRITGVSCIGYSDDEEQNREPGISCSYNNVTGRAWFVLVSNKMVKGKMTVTILYGNNVTQNIEVPFVSSLNGTWVTEIENDTLRQVAQKSTVDIYDDEGHFVKTVTIGEFTRSSSEDTMKLTKTTETQGQQITQTNSRVSTAEGNVSTLQSQMSGTTDSGLKTSITNTNTRIDNANESIQTIEKESLTVIDSDKWESGTTDNETANKTYDQIKYDNNKRIRTKTLIPITASTAISMTNTSYKVGFACFNSDKKTIVYSGSSAWGGWTTGSDNVIIINPPSGVSYIAILLCKVNGATISPSEVPSTNLYLSDKAYSTRKQTATDITDMVVTPLGETGIQINGNNRNIKLIAGKVSFCNSSGTAKDYVQITSDGKIKATDVDLKGKITATSGSIGGFDIDSDGNISGENAKFSGNITATSGSITGNINIGTTGSRMQIFVDEALGLSKNSGIRGINSSNQELVRLGFQEYSNKVRAFLRFGGSYYREDGLTVVDNNGTFTVGISDGKAYLNAMHWPTEGVDNIGDLPPGTVYLRSDSCLGVKR